ncbi:MAG: dihydrolipoamide acyltransferase [Gammaproteobacteria bacterium BRH_c0]|nr:MAG: dihydrolipoamide acyltransferase [Gammaproteobacteria bacterium BRH_c0]
MTIDVLVPKIGFSMAEGTLTEWLVDDGATVSEGQPIYSLESDKSINEVEAPASGVLKILVQPADDPIPVGTKVAEIG